MRADYLGNAITTDEVSLVSAIDDFIAGLLGYEQKIANILVAVEHAPDHCLANSYAAILWMFMENSQGQKEATNHIKRAIKAAPTASTRERMNCEMVRHWVAGDIERAIIMGDEIAAAFPRDLAIAKLSQYLHFNRGDAPAMLRTADRIFAHNRDVPHMHGMAAFAFEQCHLLDDAQAAAEAALALKPKEPWAQHALAHVYLTRGQIGKGTAFLEDARETWTELSSFMYTHNYWHLALFYLSQGKDDLVLKLYDQHCWGIEKDYSQDQIGAVSLLARMEFAGIDVGDRWEDVGQYLRARVDDTILPFLTMQYLYGLARAGLSEADDLMAAVLERSKTAPVFERPAWRDVGVPACRGLLAHARGQHETAIENLGQALPRMMEIGGSHAQRDLFDQFMLDSIIKTGRLTHAQQILELRRGFEPHSVPINRALMKVYKELDLPHQAMQAAARIQRR